MRCVTLIVLYSEMDTQCDKLTNQRRRSNVKRRKLSINSTHFNRRSHQFVTLSAHLHRSTCDGEIFRSPRVWGKRSRGKCPHFWRCLFSLQHNVDNNTKQTISCAPSWTPKQGRGRSRKASVSARSLPSVLIQYWSVNRYRHTDMDTGWHWHAVTSRGKTQVRSHWTHYTDVDAQNDKLTNVVGRR